MRRTNFLCLLFGLIAFSVSCESSAVVQPEPAQLFRKWTDHPRVQSRLAKIPPTLRVANWAFCETNDCAALFQAAGAEAELYAVEDLFMRGYPTFLVVHDWQSSSLEIELRTFNQPSEAIRVTW